MSPQLIKGLLVLAPVSLLIAGSVATFRRTPSLFALLQLVGAAGLTLVGLCHIAEGLRLLPAVGWGLPYSLGHAIDLAGAVIGLTLFPLGYLGDALSRRST